MIEDPILSPAYIPRKEIEEALRTAVSQARKDERAVLVLLYGPGGGGKTSLLRQMAEADLDDDVKWLMPIDADDSENRVFANIGLKVARELGADGAHFG